MSPEEGALPHRAPGSVTSGEPATSAGAFARYRAGDPAAAKKAAADYAGIALAAAFAVARDETTAERIAAEVVTDGLCGPEAPPDGPLAERAWVVAMARSRALERRREEFEGRGSRRRPSADAALPAEERRLGEMVDPAAALVAFAALPPPARDALSLAYGSGLAPEEVGRRIGFTPDETRDILREALLELAPRLAGDGEA